MLAAGEIGGNAATGSRGSAARWLATLQDRPRKGPVRPEVRQAVGQVLEDQELRPSRARVAWLTGMLLVGGQHVAGAQALDAEPKAAQTTLKQEALTITGSDKLVHRFLVEMARTPREQEVGLMFRTAIPASSGMLFVWPQPQHSQMWMKNCPVPEDMVFIGEDDRISRIAEDTVPYSLANVDSGGVAKATLELQGGLTAKLGIRVGDLVQSSSLK